MEYKHRTCDFAALIPYRRNGVFNGKMFAISVYQYRIRGKAGGWLSIPDPCDGVGGGFTRL